MAEHLKLLHRGDTMVLLVPGSDPAVIHQLASRYAAERNLVVLDDADDVRIEPVRAVPWCPIECGCSRGTGRAAVHYLPQPGADAFPAALLEVSSADGRERRERAEAARRHPATYRGRLTVAE